MSTMRQPDGGCYLLHHQDYTLLHHCTITHRQITEQVQCTLVTIEVKLMHLLQLLQTSQLMTSEQDTTYAEIILCIQQITTLRRRHFAVMTDTGAYVDLQNICYRRLMSNRGVALQTATFTRSCPPIGHRQYTARHLLPYDIVQFRRGFSPQYEPDSD